MAVAAARSPRAACASISSAHADSRVLGAFDGTPRGRLRVGGQAHPQRGRSSQLEGLDAQLDDFTPDGVEPLRFVAREDFTREHGEHLLRRLAHRLPRALAARMAARAQRGPGGVDIDADVPLQLQSAGGEPLEVLAADRSSQTRQRLCERGGDPLRIGVDPEVLHQFLARDRPVTVEDEVGEREPPLAPGLGKVNDLVAATHAQRATQLDLESVRGGHEVSLSTLVPVHY